jgi:hypothetical protein
MYVCMYILTLNLVHVHDYVCTMIGTVMVAYILVPGRSRIKKTKNSNSCVGPSFEIRQRDEAAACFIRLYLLSRVKNTKPQKTNTD